MIHKSVEQFSKAMTFIGCGPCPQDARWEVPGDSGICTEVETIALVFGFVRTLKPKVVVETGCNVGCVAHAIAAALHANGDGGVLFTCDVDDGLVQATRDRIVPPLFVSASVMEGVALVQEMAREADLYWIDSSDASRLEELAWLKTHGKKGAVVLAHDTALVGDLMKAVSEFRDHVFLPGPRGLGVITL